ncbi:ABC transporter ATP-binding protein [Rathayibacter sp. VKM Ac-2801]|uniref:ABC transporter ATP-binding protein n=1 Tax=Rathayibacter sp. VKM Ac-2801 TaxID=2609255 RepID=UPI00131FD5E1|nr:ABC transporter ATP-binding protein [Rathayibacter sp. VKM Ac-2801]QHC70760.1 ATP-binding cassette domain-containing protein [Rathayibacter sp. VKM Ac-2801]
MIRQMMRILGPDAGTFRRLLGALLASAVLQGVAFALMVPLITAILAADWTAAWTWVGIEVVLLAVYAVVVYRSKLASADTSRAVATNLWQRLGDHIARLPLGWFVPARTGQASKTVSAGVLDVMGLPTNLLRPFIDTFVTPAVVVVSMFFFNWQLALITAATAPFLALAYRYAGRLMMSTDQHTHDAAVDTANRLVEFAQAQPVLRAFGRRAESGRLLDDALVAQRAADRRMLTRVTVAQFGFGLVVQAAFTIVVLAGVALALGVALGPTELITLLILTTRYVQPLLDGGDISAGLRSVRNTLDRMEAILSTRTLPVHGSAAAPTEPSVEFAGVTFGYDRARPVLKGVSFTVPARSMTALVGSSGAGKTTITRLIARFWDVDRGTIRIGGADTSALAPDDLMGQLSFVFQDVYLFSGTIRDNILLAKPSASEEELERVVRLARVDEMTGRLPGGLYTQVGEGGFALSGGERQRVSIARALLKDAPIVLLDEATAALDPENEALIQEALTALTADRTLIVVAHRLQTIASADQILVLDDGRIAERGTHRELLAHGARYAAFWRERDRARGWRITPDRRLSS